MIYSCFLFFFFCFSSLLGAFVPALSQGRIHPLPIHKLTLDSLVLPDKLEPGLFRPLNTLSKTTANFTPYSQQEFVQLQNLYQEGRLHELGVLLEKSYAACAGKPLLQTATKTLFYPTKAQLSVEMVFTTFPWMPLLLFLYVVAFLAKTRLFFAPSFALHTILLLSRAYILWRPPVSNMYETLLYVPWIISLLGFVQNRCRVAASVAFLLLFLAEISSLDKGLGAVQAVLDSQFWLTIHVMLIVASYGVLLLAGALAHVYLFRPVGFSVLQRLVYLGVCMLILGTILGGVWAAESWGRFWDWDPKESWAFISCCIYAFVIHGQKFCLIGSRGFTVGAILGMHCCLFTWYGVNFILGTGLHSYGFGTGGNLYYFLFVGFDVLLVFALTLRRKGTEGIKVVFT